MPCPCRATRSPRATPCSRPAWSCCSAGGFTVTTCFGWDASPASRSAGSPAVSSSPWVPRGSCSRSTTPPTCSPGGLWRSSSSPPSDSSTSRRCGRRDERLLAGSVLPDAGQRGGMCSLAEGRQAVHVLDGAQQGVVVGATGDVPRADHRPDEHGCDVVLAAAVVLVERDHQQAVVG